MAYATSDEGAHAPQDDNPLWQESLLFLWWDDEAGIGGIHRVGHLPNQNLGNYWNGLMTREGPRYRADVHELPLTPEDRREDGLTIVGQSIIPVGPDGGRLHFEDADTTIDLSFEDFGPMDEVWRLGTGGDVERDMAAQHYETSGRARGTVRMGDRDYEVDGLCYRDHSWGPRDWEALPGHRWIPGTAGPRFWFSAAVMLGTTDLCSGGYVIRDGVRHQATNVDIVVGLEPDNVTVRNAVVTWDLEDGSSVTIDCEPINGIMMGHGNYIESDQFCRFTVRGTDVTGWCDVEISTNHRLHNQPVRLTVGAGLEMGFSTPRGRIELAERVAAVA